MPVLTLSGAPDLLALHTAFPERYPYLLQTLGAPGWDILFAFPQNVEMWYLNRQRAEQKRFFSALAHAWQNRGEVVHEEGASNLPFRGGWFVYLGYELLHELEPSVPVSNSDSAFPLACLARIPAALLTDRASGKSYAFAEPSHAALLNNMLADVERGAVFKPRAIEVAVLEEDRPEQFLHGVHQVKNYIRAGDVFQVNLSRAWYATLRGTAGFSSSLYHTLGQRNPAPFSGLINFGHSQIVSSSPERLLKVNGCRIETRPIAGTRPRANDPLEDDELRRALLAHPKERAEHIMLLDLERNDLGRVCRSGSIRVEELMGVHTYAYVHHIESTVCGELRPEIGPDRVLAALFPGGTITGCPKVRTMQIINELEQTPRMAYTGSMGYLNLDGDMDFNILIRSFMLSGDSLEFRAGAGIVADSDPERELSETRAKAKGLLRALGVPN